MHALCITLKASCCVLVAASLAPRAAGESDSVESAQFGLIVAFRLPSILALQQCEPCLSSSRPVASRPPSQTDAGHL